MTVVALVGCRLEPLGSYLKALGVLRLVGLQADARARGSWRGDTFQLDCELDRDALVEFFLERYRPTPVLSPWNSDAGFKQGSSTATSRLQAMEATADERFAPYRAAIAVARAVRADPAWRDADKATQVAVLRNRLSDDALDWLDAAIVLRSGKPAFPALLGAGGNFGRLELSPTFIGRLLDVLATTGEPRRRSEEWLRSALYDSGRPAGRNDPAGQFDPGAAGGLRADHREGKPILNPWDGILAIEGALVWASGVARRLGAAASIAAVPFTVLPSPVGQASLAGREPARAEIWAPVWQRPLTVATLRQLFAEGRLSWAGGSARTGLDAVRALKTLGADAGIDAFVRYFVSDRHGQSPLAVPVGRVDVLERSDPGVAVLATVDGWAASLRRAAAAKVAPASLGRLSRRVDEALFAAASGGPVRLQEVLIAVAEAEAVVGATERARTSDGDVRPVAPLPAADWLAAIDDGSRELRIAAALAVAVDPAVRDARFGVLRSLLRPLAPVERRDDRFAGVEWTRDPPRVGGLGARPIADVLADALVARSEAERVHGPDSERDGDGGDVEAWFPSRIAPLTGDAEALAAGMIDADRLGDLVRALLLLAPTPRYARHRWQHAHPSAAPALPAWRILAPFYTRELAPPPGPTAAVQLRARAMWARRLVAGDVAGVLADALLRWEQAGYRPIYSRRRVDALASGVRSSQLAAALLCGATRIDVSRATEACTRPQDPDRGA